ncbi:MAG TPA: TonB-dependent receptor [Rhodocyclaceae bacterium]|jgi:iron complex outermembrane receptor protein
MSFLHYKQTLLASALLSVLPALGVESETVLPNVFVSATRTARTVEDAPGLSDLVTRSQIEGRQSDKVTDLAQGIAGVWVRPGRGVLDVNQTVVMHGVPDEKRSLLLVDGMPMNDAYAGSVSVGGLSTENLDRVEVVQGPASALYGGNAMGGVIQYFTAMPTKAEYRVKVGYGEAFDTGKAAAGVSKTFFSYGNKLDNGLSLLASLAYTNVNGYASEWATSTTAPTAGITGATRTQTNAGATAYLLGDKGVQSWSDYSVALKGQYDLDAGQWIRAGFTRMTYQYDFGTPTTLLRNATGNPVWNYGSVSATTFDAPYGGLMRDAWQLSSQLNVSGGKLVANFGLVDSPKNWSAVALTGADQSSGVGQLTTTAARSLLGDVQWSVGLGDAQLLTLGGSFRNDEADTRDINLTDWKHPASQATQKSDTRGKVDNWSVFLQDEIQFNHSLSGTLGLRNDVWRTHDGQVNNSGVVQTFASHEDSALTPKATLAWQALDKLTVKAAYGQAFRAPTVYELYRTYTTSSGTTYVSNPSLKPETVDSADLGLEAAPWDGGKVRLNHFHNLFHDLVYTRTSGTYRYRINAGQAVSRGWTLDLEQKYGDSRVYANFTWTDARIIKNSANTASEGKDMMQMPSRMANLGYEGKRGDWQWSVMGRYASKQYATDANTDTTNGVPTSYDPYFVADAKVAYRIDAHMTASVSVSNLFDRNYFSYYQAPGRAWFVELSSTF